MFVSPMLLDRVDHPFDNNKFITELKLDGIRLILSKFNNKVKLYTRHNNDVTSKFPELHDIDIPEGTVLDGEIIVADSQGKPDFEAIMQRFQSKRSDHAIQYCVFDVIYIEGKKVTHLSLIERKELLNSLITDNEKVAKVQWTVGNGIAYFDLVKQHSLEGIVFKGINSKYQVDKRSKDWIKVINYQYTEAFITGFRKNEFGLLLGIGEENRIKPAGLMEFVGSNERKRFYQTYKEFIVDENEKFIFLEPKLKCKVKFRNYTKDGKLRIPSFVEFIS